MVADELYALPPVDFVSARDDRASEATAEGDRSLAAAIRKLRRPTVSAWLANLLVRERSDQVTELLELGDAMRQAQTKLDGDDLRRMSATRRQLMSALVDAAREIAHEHGDLVNESVVREIESTLDAALADSTAAEALRSGSLTKALRYAGFGSVDPTVVEAAPISGRSKAAISGRSRSTSDHEPIKTDQVLAACKASVADAKKAAVNAERQLTTAHREGVRLEQRVSVLQRNVAVLQKDLDRVRRTEREHRGTGILRERTSRELRSD